MLTDSSAGRRMLCAPTEKLVFTEDVVITTNQDARIDLILAEEYIDKEGFLDLLNARIQAKETKI